MSTNDIKEQIKDLYDVEISSTFVSKVTDKILPLIKEWQSRPLEELYTIIYLDAIHYKVKDDSRVNNKACYTCLGIDKKGHKDLLGIWIGESEGANFWLSVLTEIRNRGVKDILIACVDGLKGFPEAINTVFPETEVQLCIIHQIRNSLRYIASKNQKEFMKDLKRVYKAPIEDKALHELDNLEKKWGKKYPLVINSWKNKWENLSNYFKYPADIRRIIYTTNIIESVHRQFRKLTKTKGAFPNENSLLKLLYMGIQNSQKKWTMPMRNWSLTLSQLAIFFEGRLEEALEL
jgi:transposase-like protein